MAARKPTGRKSADDPLKAEQARLLAEQEALLRQQERARRLIEEAPKKIERLKRKQREPIRLDLVNPRTGQKKFGQPHDKFGPAAAALPRPRARKSERKAAKVQFVVFALILVLILFMVWRAIPTTM